MNIEPHTDDGVDQHHQLWLLVNVMTESRRSAQTLDLRPKQEEGEEEECVFDIWSYTHTHALKHTLKGVVVTDLIATFLWDQHIPHFMDMSGFCESVCIWRCVWLLPH